MHAKTFRCVEMGAFADPGLGASPVWHVFAIDQAGIVFGGAIGVVGDQRIRIDLGALRILGDGLAWAPGAFFDQDGAPRSVLQPGGAAPRSNAGSPTPGSTRWSATRSSSCSSAPTAAGCRRTCGRSTGSRACSSSRGSSAMSRRGDRVPACPSNSSTPSTARTSSRSRWRRQPPVAAADQLQLMRIIVGRVARRYGLRVSLSPVPFAGSVGSGAHQHFSLTARR